MKTLPNALFLMLFVCFASFIAANGNISNLLEASDGIISVNNAAYSSNPALRPGSSYYQELSKAFLAGQTSLLITPAPELLALPQPYDPVANFQFRLHDASLFKNRYYLYWGPAPSILFFMPFKIIFDFYPSDAAANLFFYLLLCTFSVLTLKEYSQLKNLQPQKGYQFCFSLMLMSLNAAMGYCLASPSIYVIALFAEQAFLFVGLWAAIRFLNQPRNSYLPAVQGLFLGLAVACRASIIPLAILILISTAWLLARRQHRTSQLKLYAILSLVPFLAIMGCLALYNFERFGTVGEFGITYQLIHAWIFAEHPFIEWSSAALLERVPRNFFYTLFTWPRLARMSPFITLRNWPAVKMPPYHSEITLGVIWIYTPLLAIILKELRGLKRKIRALNVLKSLSEPMTWVWFGAIGMFTTSLVYSFNTLRYSLDFLPSVVIAGEIYFCESKSGCFRKIYYGLGGISIALGLAIYLTPILNDLI